MAYAQATVQLELPEADLPGRVLPLRLTLTWPEAEGIFHSLASALGKDAIAKLLPLLLEPQPARLDTPTGPVWVSPSVFPSDLVTRLQDPMPGQGSELRDPLPGQATQIQGGRGSVTLTGTTDGLPSV
jgi:hypothetical protein